MSQLITYVYFLPSKVSGRLPPFWSARIQHAHIFKERFKEPLQKYALRGSPSHDLLAKTSVK